VGLLADHPEHQVVAPVEPHRGAHDVRPAGELLPPEALAEHRHRRPTEPVLVLGEFAAQERGQTQDPERSRVHPLSGDPDRLAVPRQTLAALREEGEPAQAAGSGDPVVRIRDRDRGPRHVGLDVVDPHQLLGRAIGQRPEQHRVHQGEDGGGRSRGEREREHRGGGEASFPQETPDGHPDVLPDSGQG
jgi:hypothetical protein